MLKLYKFIKGKWRLVDYGVVSKAETYLKLGFVTVYPIRQAIIRNEIKRFRLVKMPSGKALLAQG